MKKFIYYLTIIVSCSIGSVYAGGEWGDQEREFRPDVTDGAKKIVKDAAEASNTYYKKWGDETFCFSSSSRSSRLKQSEDVQLSEQVEPAVQHADGMPLKVLKQITQALGLIHPPIKPNIVTEYRRVLFNRYTEKLREEGKWEVSDMWTLISHCNAVTNHDPALAVSMLEVACSFFRCSDECKNIWSEVIKMFVQLNHSEAAKDCVDQYLTSGGDSNSHFESVTKMF
jgi:hypothetical protein